MGEADSEIVLKQTWGGQGKAFWLETTGVSLTWHVICSTQKGAFIIGYLLDTVNLLYSGLTEASPLLLSLCLFCCLVAADIKQVI